MGWVAVVLLILYSAGCNTAGAVDDRFCPGISVQYTCTSTSTLRWHGTAFTGECSGSNITLNVDSFYASETCGRFTTVNRLVQDPTFPDLVGLESTLTFTTATNLTGTTIECIVPLANPVNVTLSIIDVAPMSINSLQADLLHTQFTWTVADESSICDVAFLLTIMRVSPPGDGLLIIPNASSGTTLELYPGVYRFRITSTSGVVNSSTSYSDFKVMNAPSVPWVTTSLNGECFIYEVALQWMSLLNETTPLIEQYVLTHEVNGVQDKRLTLSSDNTTVRMSGAHLKLGKINCFGVAAVNVIGTGESAYVCKLIPAVIINVQLKTTNESVTIDYTLNTTCIDERRFTLATELTNSLNESNTRIIAPSVIKNSTVQQNISNLVQGLVYNFCAILTQTNGHGESATICGNDLVGGGTFQTTQPPPPVKLNGAELVNTECDVIYECSGDLERFTGGRVTMIAEFDPMTQMYILNGSCSTVSQFIAITSSSVVVTSLCTLTLGVLFGSLVTYRIMKKRASYKLSEQWLNEMDGNYAVVTNLGAINMGFVMRDNDAYGPVRRHTTGEIAMSRLTGTTL